MFNFHFHFNNQCQKGEIFLFSIFGGLASVYFDALSHVLNVFEIGNKIVYDTLAERFISLVSRRTKMFLYLVRDPN
jgi:hypothetical protein